MGKAKRRAGPWCVPPPLGWMKQQARRGWEEPAAEAALPGTASRQLRGRPGSWQRLWAVRACSCCSGGRHDHARLPQTMFHGKRSSPRRTSPHARHAGGLQDASPGPAPRRVREQPSLALWTCRERWLSHRQASAAPRYPGPQPLAVGTKAPSPLQEAVPDADSRPSAAASAPLSGGSPQPGLSGSQ